MPLHWREVKAVLSEHFLLKYFSDEELGQMTKLVKRRHARSGEVLFREGERIDRLVATLSGKLKISTWSKHRGEHITFFELGPAKLLYERALVACDVCCAEQVIVEEDAELLNIHTCDFLDYLDAHPQLMIRLLTRLGLLIRWANEPHVVSSGPGAPGISEEINRAFGIQTVELL